MKKKVISIIMVAALAVLPLVGCTPDEVTEAEVTEAEAEVTVTEEAEAETPATEEVETVVEEEPAEEAPYAPDVLAMNPKTFVANKDANILTSDKDGEVVRTLTEGEEITLVGTTGKGYYATEDGYFVSASDVVAKAEEPEEETQVADTTLATTEQTTTTTTTTETTTNQQTTTEQNNNEQTTDNGTTQGSDNNGQSNEQPTQEQTPVAEQETPAPTPEPTPAPTPEPQPTQEVPVTNTIMCGICGATFATDEECVAHLYAAHVDPENDPETAIGCAHPNGYTDETGGFYCPDCGGYVSAH